MSIFTTFLIKLRGLQWQIHRRLRSTTVVSSQQGEFRIRLQANDYLGKYLYARGQYELDIVSDSLLFLRSIGKCPEKGKGTVVDIGANNGVISIGMLYNGEVEKGIAIEPEPINFAYLQENIQRNNLEKRMIALQYAVSDKSGELVFELSEDNSGDNRIRTATNAFERFNESKRQTISVKADSLDVLLQKIPKEFTDSLALFWIDVQGYEAYIFKGAKELFLQGIPVVTELWPYGIARAGMTESEFCEIASGIWSSYWVKRETGFVKYPINELPTFFKELGNEGNFDNIIFT
jgi:FkbM family methyltransferase